MTLNAIPGEGPGGVFAGGDDDVNLGRQVFQKKGEGIVNGFGVNPVVIIADKDDGVETAVNSFNKPVKIDSMDGAAAIAGPPRHHRPALAQLFARWSPYSEKGIGIVVPFIQ